VLRAIGSDGSDLTTEPAISAARRLRAECVEAKDALSSDTSVAIPVALPGLDAEVRLTRSELEDMMRPLLLQTARSLEQAIRSAGLDRADVDRVLLVGGASRMPIVSELVTEALGRPSFVDAHPKHVIALGAAITAGTTATRTPVGPAPAPPAPAEPPPTPPLPRPGPVAEPVATTGGGPPPTPTAPVGEPDGLPPAPQPRPRRRALVAAVVGVGVAAAGVAAALLLAPNDGSPGADAADSTSSKESTGSTVPAAQTVAIPSTQLWTDTDVACRTGDVLDISATGTVLHDKNSAASAVDPGGLTDPGYHQYNVPGLPDANTVALIGSSTRNSPSSSSERAPPTSARATAACSSGSTTSEWRTTAERS
jgi:hypothetical protein